MLFSNKNNQVISRFLKDGILLNSTGCHVSRLKVVYLPQTDTKSEFDTSWEMPLFTDWQLDS